MGFFKDRVFAIRSGCASKLGALILTYKNEWLFNRLVPRLEEQLKPETGYLTRICALACY